MNRGIGFLGFFKILVGGSSLLCGFVTGILSFYFFTNQDILPVELLPAVCKDFLNDPLLNSFFIPYLVFYFCLSGLIAIIAGILILFMGYRLNRATKLFSGFFSVEQNIWSNRIINIFLLFTFLFGVVYLLHGIVIQLEGI